MAVERVGILFVICLELVITPLRNDREDGIVRLNPLTSIVDPLYLHRVSNRHLRANPFLPLTTMKYAP